MTNKVKKIINNVIEYNGKRYVEENSKGWLDIPELKISIEIEVHDKNKSWDDLKLSKREDELLTIEQCIWLANSKYAKELKMDCSSSKDDFFIKQPFEFNKKKGLVAWFVAYSDCLDLVTDRDSDYSGSDLGVRFVRKVSK